MLGDNDRAVRVMVSTCLTRHKDDSQIPIYKKLVEEDGLAASTAIALLDPRSFSRAELLKLLSSTNMPVVGTALGQLRRQKLTPTELEPLLTNPVVYARLRGLAALTQIGDKAAVDRIVAMLRDPNEAIRWNVRARLRLLTGRKLGPNPAAYEKWWAENKNKFTPRPPPGPNLERP
jgi:HEAT repeat protein